MANGILCTTPTLRHGVQFLDAAGGAGYSQFGVHSQAGVTQLYQFYFRDESAPCGGGFDFTNSWQIGWN